MLVGRQNPACDWSTGEATLQVTTAEKGLGVYVLPNLSPSVHIPKTVAKAKSLLGRVEKTVTYVDSEMFLAILPSTCIVPPGICRSGLVFLQKAGHKQT